MAKQLQGEVLVGKGARVAAAARRRCARRPAPRFATRRRCRNSSLASASLAVNGPEQRALAQRLGVNAYPTLLLFRDGEMRAYGGPRGLSHLTHFARSGWRNVRAAPLHRTPNNAIGWVTGLFYRLPTLLDGAYRTAAEDWGLSMPGILAVGVGGFAIAAAAIIAGLDALARDTPTRRAHVD